jgi:outer membrane protein OmpA-like peptidoglycan-associated protein
MKKILFLFIGIIVFLLTGYFCIHAYIAPAIEADIKNKAERSLLRNNLSSVAVMADGRDITLNGVVHSEALKAKAARVVAIDGHHLIDNQINVMPEKSSGTLAITPYTMLLRLKEDQSIVLSGSVANAEMKTTLLALAHSRYGQANVGDDVSIKDNAPENWQNMLMAAMNSFPRLRQGQIKLSQQDFLLIGSADSETSRQQLGEYLENTLPKQVSGALDIAIMPANERGQKVEALKHRVAQYCQKELNRVLTKNRILFETGGSVIANNSTKLLDKLVLVAMGCPEATLVVEGYTDATGAAENNKQLSLKRAQSVIGYLDKKGVSKEHLKAMGYGEEKPIATNRTSRGRALNRRIEFTVEEVK